MYCKCFAIVYTLRVAGIKYSIFCLNIGNAPTDKARIVITNLRWELFNTWPGGLLYMHPFWLHAAILIRFDFSVPWMTVDSKTQGRCFTTTRQSDP